MDIRDTLADYPYVLVRLRCIYCRRAGAYRLARLAAKYGSEITLEELLDVLAEDCAFRPDRAGRVRSLNHEPCGAYYPDLIGAPKPPHMPPMTWPLRIIAGGKK